jgi:PD-(D/E)XK nuclease superfamily
MSADTSLLVLVLVGLLYGLWRWRRRSRMLEGRDEQGLPVELRGASIAFAEKTFRSRRHGLVARVDRAYRVGGMVQLVELKTRQTSAASLSDVIELSVQRIVLRDQTGEEVSDTAWVMVQLARDGSRATHQVKLLDEASVLALAQRYRELKRRSPLARKPRPASRLAMCRDCGHLARCHTRYGDRM